MAEQQVRCELLSEIPGCRDFCRDLPQSPPGPSPFARRNPAVCDNDRHFEQGTLQGFVASSAGGAKGGSSESDFALKGPLVWAPPSTERQAKVGFFDPTPLFSCVKGLGRTYWENADEIGVEAEACGSLGVIDPSTLGVSLVSMEGHAC